MGPPDSAICAGRRSFLACMETVLLTVAMDALVPGRWMPGAAVFKVYQHLLTLLIYYVSNWRQLKRVEVEVTPWKGSLLAKKIQAM